MMNLMKIKSLLQSATSVTSNLKRCKILPSQNLAHELTLVVRLSLKNKAIYPIGNIILLIWLLNIYKMFRNERKLRDKWSNKQYKNRLNARKWLDECLCMFCLHISVTYDFLWAISTYPQHNLWCSRSVISHGYSHLPHSWIKLLL